MVTKSKREHDPETHIMGGFCTCLCEECSNGIDCICKKCKCKGK